VAGARKIAAWFRGQLDGLYARLGMPQLAEAGFDPRYSPHLIIQYSTRELVGPVQRDLASVVFVGPALRPADAPVPFPWEWLEGHEAHVLVSLGTLVQGKGLRFLERAMEAAAGQPYGVVLVGDPDVLPPPPANVLVRPFVPQLELLSRMDAVVSHGGQNTAAEALLRGVPLVCAPIRLDQPITTAQVVQAGAGRRLSFARATAAEIRDAVAAVLGDPSYRVAAARIGESLRAAGGAPAAAAHLEALAPGTGPSLGGTERTGNEQKESLC
jgi:MGT family glycosyltransferase